MLQAWGVGLGLLGQALLLDILSLARRGLALGLLAQILLGLRGEGQAFGLIGPFGRPAAAFT